MGIKSFFSRFKKQKPVQAVVEEPASVEPVIIKSPALALKVSCAIRDIPANEHMIIDNFYTIDIIDGLTLKNYYVFRKNANGSNKVDDIICSGRLVTVSTYCEEEKRYVNEIIEYDGTDNDCTLRQIKNTYFKNSTNHSLVNAKFKTAYRMTLDNIIPDYFEKSIAYNAINYQGEDATMIVYKNKYVNDNVAKIIAVEAAK